MQDFRQLLPSTEAGLLLFYDILLKSKDKKDEEIRYRIAIKLRKRHETKTWYWQNMIRKFYNHTKRKSRKR